MAALTAALPAFAANSGELCHFACTGQVAVVCGGMPQRFIMLRDGESHEMSFAKSYWLKRPKEHTIKSGDIVGISGQLETPTGIIREEMPNVNAFVVTKLETLGHRGFPECVKADARQISSGEMKNRFIHISGVASSVMRDEMNAQWNWLILRTPTGNVYVATPEHEHPYAKLFALIDAEIDVNGFVIAQNRWRRFRGQYVMPVSETGIQVTKRPMPPINAPTLPPECLTPNTVAARAESGEFVHRVKAGGVVIALSKRFYLMMPPNGQVIKVVTLPGSPLPECGSAIIAAGFVSLDFNGLILSDAVFVQDTKRRDISIPGTKPITIGQLFREAKNPSGPSPTSRSRRISVTGRVVNSPENMLAEKYIRLEQDGYYVSVDVSAIPESTLANVQMGSTVRAIGICNSEFEANPAIATFPRFTGFSLIPMSKDDIIVIARPPWWTTGRLLAVIISLLGALAAISGLCIVLKAMADRRGRLLYEEKIAHVRTETKIEERTRLAVELHDAISQTLTGVALQIDSAERANGGENSVVGTFLRTARQMLASCRRELQDCLWDLRSRTFEEKDMTEAISRAIGPHTEGISANVRFNVPRDRLTESTTHSVICIVRELVVNAVRHGKATHVWIAGEYHDGKITFSVRDNGYGFDTATSSGPSEGHFGLQGVRERIKDAGGTIQMESSPDNGTKATISIPQNQ